MSAKSKNVIKGPRSVSISALSATEARAFFLKEESYCNVDLPHYFTFNKMLMQVSKILQGKELATFSKSDQSARDFDDLNHTLLQNKDGKYAWRPLKLIHPAVYVSLVHKITEATAWEYIKDRFRAFARVIRIHCVSLPVESRSSQSDKAEQITQWWTDLEQRSIELSLEYEHLVHADITDCYSSIYTHSIVWALHSKPEAKERRKDATMIGNIIDWSVQDMSYGQTNGIPQGSVLMDFIAEMVLGYADTLIEMGIEAAGIEDYQILRYRDDYRVFVNSRNNGDEIMKIISQTLIGLGLKLNAAKTKFSDTVIRDSIKDDKIEWLKGRRSNPNLQKHLLLIHDFSHRFPNSGSLQRLMVDFHRRIEKIEDKVKRPRPLIAIAADIALKNPKTYPIAAAILSKLIAAIVDPTEAWQSLTLLRQRFEKVPNIGQMQIWLQRISLKFDYLQYDEPLCQLANGEEVTLWNSTWIHSPRLKEAVSPEKVINQKVILEMAPVIPLSEVALFRYNY